MFTVELVGDVEVKARFNALPSAVSSELRRTVLRLILYLKARVQRDKLQGQVLQHRTGKLSRSIDDAINEDPQSIIGRVFSNGTAPYAAAHEYGFHGPEEVKSFQRRQTMVFGRSIDPIIVTVQAFTRQMNIPERSFMRSTLREDQAYIERQLTEAVARAAQGKTS